MDARVKEIEARCEKARSQAEKIFGVDPLPPTEAAIGAAGLLDIAKKEWGDEWSIYDESVRAGLTAFIAADIDIPYLLTALRESAEREKKLVESLKLVLEPLAVLAVPGACVDTPTEICEQLKRSVIKGHDAALALLALYPVEPPTAEKEE